MINKDNKPNLTNRLEKNQIDNPTRNKSVAMKGTTKRPQERKAVNKKAEINKTAQLKKPTKRELLDKQKNQFTKAIEEISNSIVTDKSPKNDIDISEYYALSKKTLSKYVTLDWQHRGDINKIKESIKNYAQDSGRKRPWNIMMQAEPGSGKSHFIKSLAKDMINFDIKEVNFNMANLQRIEDFVQPLDAVRNIKVNDKLPLLFLDEFDSNHNNYSILLPLLWDGELQVGHRDLKVGKVVIILAGSGSNIENLMKASKGMQKGIETNGTKLVDLLSRINGGEIAIPGLDEIKEGRNRRVDKVCISIALLANRFGSDLNQIPWALLSFIAQSEFRYGVRSIAHFIDLIPSSSKDERVLKLSEIHLPLNTVSALKGSSLAFHIIDEDGPASVVELWKKLKESKALVKFKLELLDYFSRLRHKRKIDFEKGISTFLI